MLRLQRRLIAAARLRELRTSRLGQELGRVLQQLLLAFDEGGQTEVILAEAAGARGLPLLARLLAAELVRDGVEGHLGALLGRLGQLELRAGLCGCGRCFILDMCEDGLIFATSLAVAQLRVLRMLLLGALDGCFRVSRDLNMLRADHRLEVLDGHVRARVDADLARGGVILISLQQLIDIQFVMLFIICVDIFHSFVGSTV